MGDVGHDHEAEAKRFKVGDRFTITTQTAPAWNGYERGVIVGEYQPTRSGGGRAPGNGTDGAWPIRFDGYEYRLSVHPTNSHAAHWSCLEPEITEQDVQQAIASIQNTRRNP